MSIENKLDELNARITLARLALDGMSVAAFSVEDIDIAAISLAVESIADAFDGLRAAVAEDAQ